jgi:hypothetical protein
MDIYGRMRARQRAAARSELLVWGLVAVGVAVKSMRRHKSRPIANTQESVASHTDRCLRKTVNTV